MLNCIECFLQVCLYYVYFTLRVQCLAMNCVIYTKLKKIQIWLFLIIWQIYRLFRYLLLLRHFWNSNHQFGCTYPKVGREMICFMYRCFSLDFVLLRNLIYQLNIDDKTYIRIKQIRIFDTKWRCSAIFLIVLCLGEVNNGSICFDFGCVLGNNIINSDI